MNRVVNKHTTKEHEKTRAELKEQGDKTDSKLAALQGQGNETAAAVAEVATTVAAIKNDAEILQEGIEILQEGMAYMIPLLKESAKKVYRPLEQSDLLLQSDIDNIDTTTVPEAITLDSRLKSCESVASPLIDTFTRTEQEEQIARLRKECEELRNQNDKKRSPEKDENPRPTKKKWFPSFGKK